MQQWLRALWVNKNSLVAIPTIMRYYYRITGGKYDFIKTW